MAPPVIKNTSLIFTMPGADLENKNIIKFIKKFILKNKNAYFFNERNFSIGLRLVVPE